MKVTLIDYPNVEAQIDKLSLIHGLTLNDISISENEIYVFDQSIIFDTVNMVKDFLNNPGVFEFLFPWGNLPRICYINKTNG